MRARKLSFSFLCLFRLLLVCKFGLHCTDFLLLFLLTALSEFKQQKYWVIYAGLLL